MYKCKYCIYFSDRKYNLNKHQNAKHKDIINIEKDIISNSEILNPNGENLNPRCEILSPICESLNLNCKKLNPDEFKCKKCNKLYKSNRYLKNHEKNCNRLDKLTCPKCMISFSCCQSKYKHIKRNICKARSIIYARKPNQQNIENIENVENMTNIQNQNISNITNNNNTINIHINNYGDERIDYLSHDEIRNILLSGNNTIPLYIKNKHFNKEFPENNNIKYTIDNKCLLMENNSWQERNLQFLSNKLIKDNSNKLLIYYNDNIVDLKNEICDEEIFENIKDKLFIIYNQSDNEKYNNVLNQIKDIIKNNKIVK